MAEVKKQSKKSVAELVKHKNAGIWAGRVLTKEVPIEGGIVFTLQTISSDIKTYLNAKCLSPQTGVVDTGLLMWEFLKFSICKITGLTNTTGQEVAVDFSTVKVFNTEYKTLSDTVMKWLPFELLQQLYLVAQMINVLSDEEVEALDFTTASVAQKSSVTGTAGKPTESTGNSSASDSQPTPPEDTSISTKTEKNSPALEVAKPL
jgi:hypothetical protein